MAKTKLRDIEICIEGETLQVIPYKLKPVPNSAYLETDCSSGGMGRILKVNLAKRESHELANFILGLPDFTVRSLDSWDEFSEWDTTERFYDYAKESGLPIPDRLNNWLNGLKEYEITL